MRKLLTHTLLVAAVGCGFTPDIVLQPDSPVLIVETRGKYVRLSAYKKAERKMVNVGWAAIEDYQSWTLTPYDWEDRIERDAEPDLEND